MIPVSRLAALQMLNQPQALALSHFGLVHHHPELHRTHSVQPVHQRRSGLPAHLTQTVQML
ncbi:hypothetical protein VR7878_00237 [Vibrio ruber DSM 16370]|uniref:Uncharacterized protein n=1 Tax=Vibrio ruber (strain DSM 16370 / JCM 11486 / BCRC 17186 / CECT 7878 / LMG 23124 / VR1) TaxID=1123498 RepID=A0A1R4L9M4_VIBR1|nr:hypothetical protein VR7878_00237 [Vibrio ruber DSM 16370]